ncbi:Superoxide dismutase [Asimina triloba]
MVSCCLLVSSCSVSLRFYTNQSKAAEDMVFVVGCRLSSARNPSEREQVLFEGRKTRDRQAPIPYLLATRCMQQQHYHSPHRRKHSQRARRAVIMAEFTLIPPPYPLVNWYQRQIGTRDNALEPHMSRQTLEHHWGRHQRGYVENLNGQIFGTELDGMQLEDIILTSYNKGDLLPAFNNAAQIKRLSGYKANRLDVENAVNPCPSEDNKLVVTRSPNAMNPLVWDYSPLLAIDVWEHAYYVDYENRRVDYVSVFMEKLVSWEVVSSRLEMAKARAAERAAEEERKQKEEEDDEKDMEDEPVEMYLESDKSSQPNPLDFLVSFIDYHLGRNMESNPSVGKHKQKSAQKPTMLENTTRAIELGICLCSAEEVLKSEKAKAAAALEFTGLGPLYFTGMQHESP